MDKFIDYETYKRLHQYCNYVAKDYAKINETLQEMGNDLRILKNAMVEIRQLLAIVTQNKEWQPMPSDIYHVADQALKEIARDSVS